MKQALTFMLLFTSIHLTHAQAINYHDVDPDTTVNTIDTFTALGVDIIWNPAWITLNTTGNTEVLTLNDTTTKAQAIDDEIADGSSGTWRQQHNTCLNCGGVDGMWKTGGDRYIGVRQKAPSGQWLYGWIRLEIPPSAASFTIKEYAIRTQPGEAIFAGQAFGSSVGTTTGSAPVTPRTSGRSVSFHGLTHTAHLRITDMLGRAVAAKNLTPGQAVDMSAYPAGFYIFTLSCRQGIAAFKIAVQ